MGRKAKSLFYRRTSRVGSGTRKQVTQPETVNGESNQNIKITEVMRWIPWGWLIATPASDDKSSKGKWEGVSKIRKRLTPWWGILRGWLSLGCREHIWEECKVHQSSLTRTTDGCLIATLTKLNLTKVIFSKVENLKQLRLRWRISMAKWY